MPNLIAVQADVSVTLSADARRNIAQDETGANKTATLQVFTSKKTKNGHHFRVTGLVGELKRYAVIGPDTLNDYTSESDANKAAYAFIADSVTLKMSNGDDPYLIR